MSSKHLLLGIPKEQHDQLHSWGLHWCQFAGQLSRVMQKGAKDVMNGGLQHLRVHVRADSEPGLDELQNFVVKIL